MEQRKEGFYESKIQELEVEVKSLSFDNAELVKSNDELTERVKTLASRQPTWPKGIVHNGDIFQRKIGQKSDI